MSRQESSSLDFISPINPDWMHVQLNDYDFYMTKPGSLDTDHGNSLPMNQYSQVPVIRVYGCLPSGHQAMCHVHGVFPYIYIAYDGNLHDSSTLMIQKCAQMHRLLETRCQETSTKKDNSLAKQAFDTLNFIANVSVVKAVPFYGFHVGWSLFYKISLLNPGFSNKFSDLLRDGKLLGKQLNTYETHLPYLLQFSVDFNLFGCSWMDFDRCYFRKPVLNPILSMDVLLMDQELKKILRRFHHPESNVLLERDFPRMGNGLLEIDIIPQYIRNIDELKFHGQCRSTTEAAEDTLNKPHVMSTKNIVKDITMQRRSMSLEQFKPSVELERIGIDDQWQSSEEFTHAFKRFEQELESNAIARDPTNEAAASLMHVKQPHETTSELWPPPKISYTKRSTTNLERSLIDTLDNDYSIAEVSDVELENKINQANSQVLSHQLNDNSEEAIKVFSLDATLTQQMAKKKRKVIGVQNRKHLEIRVTKLRQKRNGIQYEPSSYKFRGPPIDSLMILQDLERKGYPKHEYIDPFFGNPLDLKPKPYIYAGKRFEINSTHLSRRIPLTFEEEPIIEKEKGIGKIFHSWKYLKKPPNYVDVKIGTRAGIENKSFISQIGRSLHQEKIKFKYKRNATSQKSSIFSHNTLSHFSLEIHVETKGSKRPDPAKDEVKMIAWHLEKETFPFDLGISHEGILVAVDPNEERELSNNISTGAGKVPVAFYQTELDMIDALTDLILLFDADILSGFEVHNSSWGYIIDRCKRQYHIEISDEFSRVKKNIKSKIRDRWGLNHASGVVITGRHVINIWRALRSEVDLTQYTIENLAFELLNERIPHYSFEALTQMWECPHNSSKVATLINYWMHRVRLNVRLLQKQDYIARIIEQSRLTGIDFFSVYYRGSQYKVESILFRLCKQESFVLISPSRRQVKKQKALECVPLVMEPESAFYKSPLVVLDFQSLYPSIMIAYNYCYSTMIGRVRDLNFTNELGVTQFPFPKSASTVLQEHTRIAPNGVVYVKSSYRISTLAKMLNDLLNTRMMVKKTMNDVETRNIALQKLLNRRQLALKLIANVTYGYTSASFSGRMPCSDLADSIVQTGREILEKAIDIIETNEEWGAKVVYGDTDSLFVYLPGKGRKEAYEIGNQMAREVTSRNRSPILLKYEKVYHPSLLLSKKRYVGSMYEHPSQNIPSFDAKGIETVRRDGHPAQQKIVKKCIQILFRSKDLSEVKRYMQNEFMKIHQGKVSLQDFCFAREVRLGSYKSEKTAPPGAVVAARQAANDHRATAQYRERVPYVVARGTMGQILRERCISPEEFLSDETLELDSDYYIEKTLVPPLSRLFNILGVNVADWAFEVARNQNAPAHRDLKSIERVLLNVSCINCGSETSTGGQLCENCQRYSRQTAANLLLKRNGREDSLKTIKTVCRTCSYRYTRNSGDVGDAIAMQCTSYDCPVYFSRVKTTGYINSTTHTRLYVALESIDNW